MPSIGLIFASVLVVIGLTLVFLPSLLAYPLQYVQRQGRYAQISPAQMETAINRLERYIAIKEGERADILAKQAQRSRSGVDAPPGVRGSAEVQMKEEKTKGYLKQLDDLQREIEGMIAERQRQKSQLAAVADDTLHIPPQAQFRYI